MEIQLNSTKKIYFASDFHLGGAKSDQANRERELRIIQWLKSIEDSAQCLFLVGDIFDFWFEYKTVIPKGYTRFIAQLHALQDKGVKVYFFTGNHDMWLFDYFEKEMGIQIFREPIKIQINSHTFFIGHGDGLGPGDKKYKILKKIFSNPICQKLFRFLHPDIGISIANAWSNHSRKKNILKGDRVFQNENEWLWTFCKEHAQENDIDFYIFGHRHLPLILDINDKSVYFNSGEWMDTCTYLVYDGNEMDLISYVDKKPYRCDYFSSKYSVAGH